MSFVNHILEQYERINFDEVGAENLLDRKDTKYLLDHEKFSDVLLQLIPTHFVVQFNGYYSGPYSTTYFDTSDFRFYNNHRKGKPHRYKVRVREYISTADSFLEVKEKTKGRTIKHRILLKEGESITDHLPYIEQYIGKDAYDLKEVLKNTYQRITLKHKSVEERITFDVGLMYKYSGKKYNYLSEFVIAETKSCGSRMDTQTYNLMKKNNLRPLSFSKYCLGVAQFHNLKTNNFKPTLRTIEKVKNEYT